MDKHAGRSDSDPPQGLPLRGTLRGDWREGGVGGGE